MFDCREMGVTDVDMLVVLGQLHELIGARSYAMRCYRAVIARRPQHFHSWLRLVRTTVLFCPAQ